jgi:hypothetical protein
MLEQWPNNPDDDGNALAGVLHAVLVEAVVAGLVVLLWWWWVAIVPWPRRRGCSRSGPARLGSHLIAPTVDDPGRTTPTPTTIKAGVQAIPKGREVEELVAAIGRFCEGWNQRCQPFRWTKDADQILTQFERQTLQGRTTSVLRLRFV